MHLYFYSSMFSTRTCININAPFRYFFDVFDMKSIPCKWEPGDAELCTTLPMTNFSQCHHPRPPPFAIFPRRHLEEPMTWLSLRNLSSAYNWDRSQLFFDVCDFVTSTTQYRSQLFFRPFRLIRVFTSMHYLCFFRCLWLCTYQVVDNVRKI